MCGISQDMKKQDNKLEESMVGNQCFMTNGSTNEHVEECARHRENNRVSYSLVTEIERTTTVRGCTHEEHGQGLCRSRGSPNFKV